VQSDDVSNTGPSTIDKRKKKKRYAKKPCNSEERLNLIVDHSAEMFYDKYVGKMLFKNSKKLRETRGAQITKSLYLSREISIVAFIFFLILVQYKIV
jgi:hypothetical protein